MIDIDGVTRENFDSSGLSTGYAVATKVNEIEGEILGLIRGVFEGLPNVPVRDTDTSAVRGTMLARVSGVQAQATDLFAAARNELFGSLNLSLENGYAVGQRSGALQTGREAADIAIADSPYGKETVRTANRNLLQAEAAAVTGAVTGLMSGIALLTGGAVALSDMTYQEAYDRYVVPTFKQGLPGKHTSDGRSISLTSYAEAVTRESSQEALLIGESEAAKAAGLYLVQISAHYSACPLCVPWQNAILVDDVYADGKPDGVHALMSVAKAAGLFHYNCRHVKRIYIPGRTLADNPPNYDPEKVAVNYELEQIQRRLEREIRNEKRVRDMSLTDAERSKAERAIRNKQLQLRGLVRFADEHGYKVYRQYWKEQVDFVKKPVLPYPEPAGLASDNSKPEESGKVLAETRYTDLSKELDATEKEIANYEVEHAYVFTRDGRKIHVQGNRFTVNTEVVGTEALKGAVITHNHPHELRAPSLQDLQSIARDGLAELRTLDKTNLYVVRFEQPMTEEEVGDIYKEAKLRTLERARLGEIEIGADEQIFFLEEFVKLAKGVQYERIHR